MVKAMWARWTAALRNLILVFVPADEDPVPDTGSAEEVAAVVDELVAGAEAPATEAPTESEVDRLTRENSELRAGNDAAIREEAEKLLMEVMPESQPSYQPPPAPTPDGEEESMEERVERLEGNQRQGSLDLQSQELVNHLGHLRDTKFKHMDMTKVLNVIASRPGVNIYKVVELNHNSNLDALEAFHQSRLIEEGGAPAADTARKPPVLPGKGSAPSGGEPVTTQNARRIFAERLRARGFGT